jgi:hypothetical protein
MSVTKSSSGQYRQAVRSSDDFDDLRHVIIRNRVRLNFYAICQHAQMAWREAVRHGC